MFRFILLLRFVFVVYDGVWLVCNPCLGVACLTISRTESLFTASVPTGHVQCYITSDVSTAH
jgi:hypothetical protein